MYLTDDERIELARISWDQASKAAETLRRKLKRAERAATKLDGMDRAIASEENALIGAQYATLVELEQQRWMHYRALWKND